jgi:hypothetical protein
MNLSLLNKSNLFQDTAITPIDTVKPIDNKNTSKSLANTAITIKNKDRLIDSSVFLVKKTNLQVNQKFDSNAIINVADTMNKLVQKDSISNVPISHNFFSFNILSDSFDYNYNDVYITRKDAQPDTNFINIPHEYHRSQLNWALLIGFLCILLMLFIKTYYQKFLEQVIGSFLNYQLADKMYKEKNILLRRAFFILNLNFILIVSLYFLILSGTFEIHITNRSYLDYLIILSGVILILLLRYSIFYLTGTLFMQQPVIMEYIHNKYLLNKNIGIALIPIVFTSIYVSPSISKILLLGSLAIIVLITILKILRGFQIFLQNGVLLFYTILYLCTLELLPLVLGSKIISTLR